MITLPSGSSISDDTEQMIRDAGDWRGLLDARAYSAADRDALDEIVRVKISLAACNGVGVLCTEATHDHTTPQGRDGETLAVAVAMFCNDCGAATHYNSDAEDYFHDDAPSCFLAYAPEYVDQIVPASDGVWRWRVFVNGDERVIFAVVDEDEDCAEQVDATTSLTIDNLRAAVRSFHEKYGA